MVSDLHYVSLFYSVSFFALFMIPFQCHGFDLEYIPNLLS